MSAPVYDPNRTFVVDTLNDTYLVRGNEPLESDGVTFAYDGLNSKLQSLIGGGFDLTDYNLLDVSIIDDNPASERSLLEAEFAAYGITNADFDSLFPWPGSWPPIPNKIDVTKQYGTTVSGNQGSVIWYPVQGCTDMSNCQQVEPTQYKFIEFVDYLRNLLETEAKAVIYFHCEHGHDRTGATAAGYMIKYLGLSLNDVMTKAPPAGAKDFTHAWEPTYSCLIQYYDQCYTPAAEMTA